MPTASMRLNEESAVEDTMEPDQPAIAGIRALLKLTAGAGERLPEEWKIVGRRIEVVHDTAVSHDTEPAGAPRLDAPDE